MPVVINGTTGISGVDGSAGTPAVQGTDNNTGMFFPAADTIGFAEGGAEVGRFDSGGRFGVGITPSAWSASYKVQQTGFVNTYSLSDYQGGFVRGAFFNGSNWIAQNSFMGMARYMMDENNHYWAIAPGVTSGTTVTWTTAMTVNSSGKLILGVAGQGIQFADGTTQTTAAASGQMQSQIFTATGTTTWTAPAGVTRVKATVVGGGGGSNAGTGASGGSGGIAVGIYTVVPGTGYSVTVGAGGAGGGGGLPTGGSGASSSFASFCSATGGAYGGANGSGSGGTLRNTSMSNNTPPAAMTIFGGSFLGQGSVTAAQLWSISSSNTAGAPGLFGGGVPGGGFSGGVLLEWVG